MKKNIDFREDDVEGKILWKRGGIKEWIRKGKRKRMWKRYRVSRG